MTALELFQPEMVSAYGSLLVSDLNTMLLYSPLLAAVALSTMPLYCFGVIVAPVFKHPSQTGSGY